MKRFYLSKLIILVTLLLGSNVNLFSQTSTYSFTGTEQTYVVPPGVISLGIDAIGGAGGYPYWQCSGTASYALAGRVQCVLAVTPGQTLYIYVGGAGGSEPCQNGTVEPGGFNGGVGGSNYAGGSGGATDIRLTPTSGIITVGGMGQQVPPYTLTNRIVVAGGGGGGADWYGTGGAGGGTVGGTGVIGTDGGTPGTGGTQVGGGTGGNTGSLGIGGTRVQYTGGGGGYWGGGSGSGISGGGGGGSSYTDPGLCTSVIHTQGYAPAIGNGSVKITVLCTAPGTISGNAPMCAGTNLTLSETTPGGIWSSATPAVATVGATTGIVTTVSPGNAVITYTVSNPCGGIGALATATLTVLPTPSILPATTSACQYSTTTLSDTASGGTWLSSNPAYATVSSTGVVTGITPGSLTISYTLPSGCATSTAVTVKGAPAVYNVTGGGAYCATGTGVHIGLNGSDLGYNYQLFNGLTSVTSLTGTGGPIDFGLYTALGTYTVAGYNLSTGCSNVMFGSAIVTVNPLPAPITGIANVCVGSTTTLSDPTPGGTWSSGNPGVASVGFGSGIVTGIVAGVPSIFYTLSSTGCRVSAPVLVNPLPAAITGATAVCSGATTTLFDVTPSGTWSSSNSAIAAVGAGTGIVTGTNPGSATISYTLVTGCTASVSMLVNTLPALFTVTGGGSYCSGPSGVHIGLSFSNAGVSYQLYYAGVATGAPVAGSGSGIDFGAQVNPGSYTVQGSNASSGCTSTMTGSVNVTILPLPALHNVTGGGGYCAGGTGVNIGLDGSNAGIKYQLYNGIVPVGGLVSGTGLPLNFGIFTTPGIYTISAINPSTGCTAVMNNNATVFINALPTPYTVAGGGNFCLGTGGVHILLLNSDFGNTYDLKYLGGTVNSVVSLGGLIDFGPFSGAGTYTVVGTDGTSGCTNNMSGSATVVINPLPTVYTVTPTAITSYCAGGTGVHVGLNFSNTGINYTLIYSGGSVSTVAGSGTSLDFGAQTNSGIYSVTATNSVTGCVNTMSGNASIGINPLPTANNVTGGGSYCSGTSGVSVGTDFSDVGVNYQLFKGTARVGLPVTGTGPGVSFGSITVPGTYTVVATNPGTGCVMNQLGSATVSVNPLPVAHTVTGGGQFCALDTGVHIGLNGSEIGVNYSLLPTSVLMPGTGGALDFGLVTTGGAYTVVATNATTGCVKNMTGSANVIVNPLPTPFNVVGGGNYCAGGSGLHVGLDGSSSGISYYLYDGVTVGGPLAGTGTTIDFGLKTAGTYTVWGANVITGCQAWMNGSAAIGVNALPADYTIDGGGNYCAGGLGMDVFLDSSDGSLNIDYQLYNGITAVGSSVTGAGGVLDFGPQTAPGIYTVIATDETTTCTKRMPGTATINIISPAVFIVNGGGNYCAGGPGVVVGQGGSASTETYQLYNSWAPVGATVSGTGSSLNFGLQTTAGSYTVIATNILYGCSDTMAGSATVGINPLPNVNNVTGGGAYCAGGAGYHVGLNNSDPGILYQLYYGSSSMGVPAAGTGLPLDFGSETAAGTYTVIGKNAATSCSDTMSGSAVITINPLPHPYIVGIENDGYYCASDTSGVHIYLGGSDTDVTYKLYRGTTLIGTSAGTGAILDFGRQLVAGTYLVVGADTGVSGCMNNMGGTVTVTIMPLPIVHNVTGGGSFCPGASGVHIGLDASDDGIRYTIHRVGYANDTSSIWGSGAPIDFGIYDSLGTYTVNGMSHHLLTGCANDMFGSAVVALDTILTPTVTLRAYPGNGLGVWHIDSMHAYVANGGPNPTYEWVINGHVIPGVTGSTFTHYQFFNGDSVACIVTASGPCGGYNGSQSLIISLHDVGVNTISAQGTDVKLIPNPNKGVFTVKGNLGTTNDEEVTMEVTNMLGQVLYSNKVISQAGNIDQRIELSNMANGMYLLNLRSGAQSSIFHFVVEQ